MRALEAKEKGLKTEFNKFLLAIPALSDFITTTLHYVALNFISGSVYQMMRGGSIVTTLIFSVFFLKSKVMKNQIAGAGLVLFGVAIVGLSNFIFKNHSGDGASAVIFSFISGFANHGLHFDHLVTLYQQFLVCF